MLPRLLRTSCSKTIGIDLPFRIIGRVCEHSGIETAGFTVRACKDYSVLHRIHELVVQKNSPLTLEEFTDTMGEQRIARDLSTVEILEVILEGIR